ncbi:hypothetical protein JHK84_049230 [Glycine max]|nr:hypothetical protein JHK84_049230 [Glycine max]
MGVAHGGGDHVVLSWLVTLEEEKLFIGGWAPSLTNTSMISCSSTETYWAVELDTPVKNCLNIFGLERSDLNKSTGKSIPYLKLRELPDESFKILCPNIVEKQEELFKGLEQQLSGFASNVGKCKIGKNAVANQGVNNVVAKSESSDQQVTSLWENHHVK